METVYCERVSGRIIGSGVGMAEVRVKRAAKEAIVNFILKMRSRLDGN